MSETNGKSPIMSLEAARANKVRKGNDFATLQQAYDIAIQECAKVHEHYLQQIPTFTARMIQDALLSYGLIKPLEGVDIAPIVEGAEALAAATPNGSADSAAPADVESATQPDQPEATP